MKDIALIYLLKQFIKIPLIALLSLISRISHSKLVRKTWRQYRALPKLAQRAIAMLLIITTFLTSGTVIYLLSPLFTGNKAEAAWYDDNWQYRKAITITNNTSGTQTNLQYLLTIDTQTLISTNKLQSSCQDLRFTNQSGNILPYYIDSGCNTTTTKVWVLVDSLPSTNGTIYMYYGNSAATAGSNATQFDNVVGLVGYWTFNDASGSTVTDASVTAGNGTWQGTLGSQWTSSGKYNYGGSFNGSDNFVKFSNVAAIDNITSTITIEAWIKTSNAGGQQIYSTWDGTHYVQLYQAGGKLALATAGSTAFSGTTTINDGNWHHVVGVVNGASSVVYVDGNSDGTGTLLAPVATTRDNQIGTQCSGANSTSCNQFFNGTIDDVHVYNTARSATQVKNDYGQTYTIQTATAIPTQSFAAEEKAPSPILYLKFDEGQGQAVHSSVNTGVQTTTTNMVTNPSFESGTTSWAVHGNSTISQSSSFSKFGTNSLKVISNDSSANGAKYVATMSTSTTYTFSAWVYSPSGGAIDISAWRNDFGQSAGIVQKTVAAGTWTYFTSTFTTSSSATWGTLIIRDLSGASQTFYVDGVQLELASSATPFCDGSNSGSSWTNAGWTGTANASSSTCSAPTTGTLTDSGTGTAIPTWQDPSQCISGKCLYFDGASSYVNVATSSADFQGDFTVEAWVNPKTVNSAYHVIVEKGNSGASCPNYQLEINSSNKFQFITEKSGCPTGDSTATSNNTPSTNTWYHVVGVRSNGIATLYVNGIAQTTTGASNTADLTNSAPVTIGAQRNGTNSYQSYFNGMIDEVKIYPFAKSAAQIKADYAARGNIIGGSVLGAQVNSTLNNGLVGNWKMDEATWSGTTNEVLDSSGNANNGTAQGGANDKPYPQPGKFGTGGWFEGTDDYVSVARTTSLQTISTSGTISAWVKESAVDTSLHTIYDLGGTGANGLVLWSGAGSSPNTSAPGLQCGNGSTSPVVVTTSTPTANTWYHIVGTFDPSGMKIYYNGVLQASNTSACNVTITATTYIGSNTGTIRFHNGMIDDLRVYNRALSPAEVQQLYNFAPGPVGYWNFEEGGGTTVNDLSGNGNNGSWNGTGTPHYIAGKVGTAGNFNGTNDYVSVANSSGFQFDTTNAFTASVWVKTTYTGFHSIMGDANNSGQGWFLSMNNGFTSISFVDTNTVSISQQLGGAQYNDGLWHYLTFTYNGNDNRTGVTAYADGKLISNGSSSSNFASYKVVTNFALGNAGASYNSYFSGVIDEARVYNYVRTTSQIIQDMNAGHPNVGNATPVGYWKFDEGYGTTAHDSSGHGDNGTLGNFASPATVNSGWTNDGKFGKALTFNDNNSNVLIADASPIQNIFDNGGTVSVWINPTSSGGGGFGRIMEKGGWLINLEDGGGGTLILQFEQNFASGNNTWNSPTFTKRVWTHIVITYNNSSTSNTPTIYFNGVQQTLSVANATASGARTTDAGTNLIIGNNNGSLIRGFDGVMDEIKLYNGMLSASDVKAEYTHGTGITLGGVGLNPNDGKTASNSASAAFCVPGDTSTCTAPIGDWEFDEGKGTSVNDVTGNNNTGTWNGTLGSQWTAGKYNAGGNFNGTDNYVNIPNPSAGTFDFGTSTNFTVEGWFYLNSIATTNLLAKRLSGGPGTTPGWKINVSAQNTLAIIIDDGSNSASNNFGNTIVTANTWQHYAVTFNRSGNATAYINGVNVGTIAISSVGNITNAQPLVFGNVSDHASTYFNGKMDQIRIFNYVRSPAQIAYDYNRGAPVGWWKFDEGQGTTAYDSTGNGNNGTITPNGGKSVGTVLTSNTMWGDGASGKFNYSLSFDGTANYIAIPGSTTFDFGTSDITASAWIKTTSIAGNQGIIEKRGTGSAGSFKGWDLRLNGGCLMSMYDDGVGNSVDQCLSSSSAISTNQWYFVAVTYTHGGTATGYINGVNVGSASIASVGNVASGNAPVIGKSANSSALFFSGQIDDARVYNYALTATQIKQVYNGGAAVRYGPNSGTP